MIAKRIIKYLREKRYLMTSRIQELKKDLERNNIREEKTVDREVCRKQVLCMDGFQGGLHNKPCAKWSEDRKKQNIIRPYQKEEVSTVKLLTPQKIILRIALIRFFSHRRV